MGIGEKPITFQLDNSTSVNLLSIESIKEKELTFSKFLWCEWSRIEITGWMLGQVVKQQKWRGVCG